MDVKWFSTLPVVLALGLAIVFSFVDQRQDPEYFTLESLNELRSLNLQYGMQIEDLSTVDEMGSPLISELVKANVFNPSLSVPKDNNGLIVSLGAADSQGGFLLLQPQKQLSEVELTTLARRYEDAIPEFEAVEVDQELTLQSPQYEWSLVLAEGIQLSSDESEEEPAMDPIKVAVVDSGVDLTHELFVDEAIGAGWNTITDDTAIYDDVGHGTHIAGIIAMETENVEILPYKIVDKNGGKLSNVIEAVYKAMKDDVDVINMSFGVTSPSYSLERLVRIANDEQILLVAASGNYNKNNGFYPAEYDGTIAVASVDEAGEKLPSSNYGDWVDVAINGYHIRSSVPDNQYGYKSGTSQATAFVTARIINWLQHQGSDRLSFEQILRGIQATGEPITEGSLAGVVLLK